MFQEATRAGGDPDRGLGFHQEQRIPGPDRPKPWSITFTEQCKFTRLTLAFDRGLPSIGRTLTLPQSVSMPWPASTTSVP